MKKKIVLVLCGCLLAGSLAGCGGSTESAGNGDSEIKSADEQELGDYEMQELEDTEFTFYQFSVENHDNYQKLIDSYNQIHPNVKINLESVGGGSDWRASLKAKIAGGEEPTIILMEGPADFEDFSDYLTDLSDQPWVEHLYESVVPDVTVDGKIVAAPSSIVNYGLVYNKKIFEAAGIDASALTTYEAIDAAFADLEKQIENGELSDEFPMLEAVCELPAKEAWVLGNHASNIALGQEFSSGIEAYEAPEIAFEYADAFKDYIDLQVKYSKYADDPSALNAVDYATALGGGFAIERVAVIQMGQWVVPEIQEIAPELLENIGILPMPLKGVVEDTTCYGTASYLTVNKHSDEAQQAAAKDFLNYMIMSEAGKDVEINVMNGNMPFDNYGDYPVQNPISAAGNEYAEEGKTTPLVFGGYPSGWSDALGADIQSYLAGSMTWDQVIDNAKANWQEMR